MENQETLSVSRLQRIRDQGYFEETQDELIAMAYGNRFAYILCTGMLTLGVLSGSILILSTIMCIVTLTLVLPYHPFDHVYNMLIANGKDKLELPPRSPQIKFAYGIKAIWIGQIICLFATGLYSVAFLMGCLLVVLMLIVSITDLCLFSVIYNSFFLKDSSKTDYSIS